MTKKFHLISIFPHILDSYFEESMLKRAQANKLIKIVSHNLRDYAEGRHQKTDYKPYGGGPGLVMFAEPILKAVKAIRAKSKTTSPKIKIIMLSPTGKQFSNEMAIKWAKKYDEFIFICGRYEGVDARVKKILKAEEVSVGPFVLTGGELPSAVMIDAIARQVPGVLGNEDSPEEKRISCSEVYTRPEVLEWAGKKYKAPKVLLSGHAANIEEWKKGKRGVK